MLSLTSPLVSNAHIYKCQVSLFHLILLTLNVLYKMSFTKQIKIKQWVSASTYSSNVLAWKVQTKTLWKSLLNIYSILYTTTASAVKEMTFNGLVWAALASSQLVPRESLHDFIMAVSFTEPLPSNRLALMILLAPCMHGCDIEDSFVTAPCKHRRNRRLRSTSHRDYVPVVWNSWAV